ncbi:GTP diphosphokinase [Ahniella affigens]|uniref:GTP pyrophosphokinase n=1 Tax=Ahniella affigens TaxID=2021234 RepID=A0A2P1PR98_9GAMM|nr:bifunctional (p)ppGpp synthetase/guanosine-3',5'-bis(diphosphate) 3'-pyrophosphohydrolase [Ahniella affigens]AVP97352.1 GTP diphosphokinase [Ahniella affigens]
MQQTPAAVPDNLEAWLATLGPERAQDPGLRAACDHYRQAPRTDRPEAQLVAVLGILQQLGVDTETLAATAWHACAQIPDKLPQRLRALIEGQNEAQRVWSLYAERGTSGGAEGLRRLLLAIIKDLRVVFVLLSEQLLRLRQASQLPESERRAAAQLTADIHAPLANRLGVWQVKWELEDWSFRYLQPEQYRRIAKALDERRGDREHFIVRVKADLLKELNAQGIQADIAGRPKHIYSIWRKMSKKQVDLDQLYDVRAVRVIVQDVPTCYAALGVVHALWPPIPGEFDDYIARPKGNNYRSLHTAVIGPDGKALEVQIRTLEMHEHAELGVAAHWRYKEGGAGDAAFERKIAGLRQMLEAKADTESDAALLAGLQTDVVDDRVYLLTPQGKVVDLPRGATVLDFAYHVHTEVGHRCRGAKINGRLLPLESTPTSGDVIEIVTAKVSEPRRDWVIAANHFLTTPRAKEKVRAYFRKLDHERNVVAGRELVEKELKRIAMSDADLSALPARFNLKTVDELYVAIGIGEVTTGQIARGLHELTQPKAPAKPEMSAEPPRIKRRDKDAITIEGIGNLLTQMARCCQPIPGDPIVGYLTRGKGVSIHRAGCASYQALIERDPDRRIDVSWGQRPEFSYEVEILVRGYDRKGLLKDVSSAISAADAHVIAASTRLDADHGTAEMHFAVRVNDFAQLSGLLNKVAGLPNVIEARRKAK